MAFNMPQNKSEKPLLQIDETLMRQMLMNKIINKMFIATGILNKHSVICNINILGLELSKFQTRYFLNH